MTAEVSEPQRAYVISPLSQCASPEKQERFLEYIRKIAPVTEAYEPDCVAYAWFRSADDNDDVPKHWLRGFEVYKYPEASTVTHRASDEYKAFRTAVGSESLLVQPSDLRPWYDIGIGYMRHDSEKGSGSESSYVIVNELKPKQGKKLEIVQLLKGFIADLVSKGGPTDDPKLAQTFASLIAFDRGGEADPETEEKDEGLYVLMRCENKKGLDVYREGKSKTVKSFWEDTWNDIEKLCDWRRKTTWTGCGVGFIGR